MIVSVVPVLGDQVILNGVPAVIELKSVNEKGFCAATNATRPLRERRVENCIFAGSFESNGILRECGDLEGDGDNQVSREEGRGKEGEEEREE